MKKKLKTYAIPGMMEFQTRVFVGRTPVKISFSGGSVNNGCARPARYETSNLIIQNAIEASSDFRRGLIRLERSFDLPEDIPVSRPDDGRATCFSLGEANSNRPVPSGEPADGRAVSNRPVPSDSPQGEAALSKGESTESEASDNSQLTTDNLSPLQIVDVSCKDDAKAFLQDRFGENPAPLRTRDLVQQCAAKYGIQFNFS